MARFVDTIIDYPNAKLYVAELIESMVSAELLSEKMAVNYKLHLENIERQARDDWPKIWETSKNYS